MRDPSRMRSQVYCYAGATHEHSRRLFRFSHLRRYELALRLLDAGPDLRILDYGTGDGYLIGRLLPLVPEENLTALEPLDFLQQQFRERFSSTGVLLVDSPDQLPSGGYERISCLEVLEHLRPPDLAQALDQLSRLLAPGGILLVSVPLETGLSALAKYLAARILTRMDRWYTFGEVLRATVGLPVPRDGEGSFLSHKGFDHREVKRELLARFRLEREVFSPFAWSRGFLNAQVFWRLRREAPSINACPSGARAASS